MMRGLLTIITCFLLITSIGAAESLVTGGPYTIGDQIRIHGDTNYNTDNRVLVEVFPASFGPTSKYEPSMTGGSSVVVPVIQTGTGKFGWSVNMSTTAWKPDQYMVRVEIIGKDFRESAILNLAEQGTAGTNASSPNNEINGAVNLSPATKSTIMPDQMSGEIIQKEEILVVPSSPSASETKQPHPTRESPLSFMIILISFVAVIIVAKYKKE